METQGKRATRAAGPVGLPAEAPAPLATPVASAVMTIVPASIPAALEAPSAAAEGDALAPPAVATASPVAADPPASVRPAAILPAESPLAAIPQSPVLLVATRPAESPAAESRSASDFADFGYQALAALTESQAALARGLEAISVEVAGLTRSGIDRAARIATDMLSIKTFSDAIGVNAVFACAGFDSLISGSAKLSELGVRLAAESSQPILTRFGEGWMAAARLGH